MEISTVSIIATLVVGGFLIFQDVYEIQPLGVFSFSPQFYIGVVLIIGAIIVFTILSINRNRIKNSNPKT